MLGVAIPLLVALVSDPPRQASAPIGLESVVVAAHGRPDVGVLSTRVALAVERVAQQAVEQTDLAEDVNVQVVRLAVAALLDAKVVAAPVRLGRACGQHSEAAEGSDQDGGPVKLVHVISLE